MSTTDAYLQKRREGWYVVVEIPKGLRAALGHPRFVESLQTRDRSIANVRKWTRVAHFKDQIDRARRGDPLAEERAYVSSLRAATPTSDGDPGAYDAALDIIQGAEKDHGPAAARELHAVLQGSIIINEVVETWLRELAKDPDGPTGQTISQHRSAVKQFTTWSTGAGEMGGSVEEVTRKKAGAYIAALLDQGSISRRTIQRHASSLSGLWQWIMSRNDHLELNPWTGHKLGKKRTKKVKRPYTDQELVTLLSAPQRSQGSDKYHAVLQDLMRLDLFNGARLEEWCSLESRHVAKRDDGYWVTIVEGKTASAVRAFPVASCATHIVERRLADGDKYLFKDLIPGGPDRKRMWYISKSFARLADRAKVEDPNTDFHSFRRSFQDACEGVGIPESTTKLIVGHARESMTYGLYSKGTRVDLRKAVERVRYGASVMKLVRRT